MPKPEMLAAMIDTQHLGVDRENNIIRGVVLAQEGPFKTKGRGEFALAGLKAVKAMINKLAGGLPSRWAHPGFFEDAIGKRVGKFKNPQMGHVSVERNGETVLLHAVRADLHLYKFAMKNSVNGGTPYGVQLMDMLDEDPSALATSLVIRPELEYRTDPKTKRPALDANGEPLPPLWKPKELEASDFVDRGEAVDSALSAAEQLAASSEGLADTEFEVGDTVQWYDVDEDRLESCLCEGVITQIATDGSLMLTGSEETMEAPCAEVGWDDDEDDDIDCWKLIALDKLSPSDGSDVDEGEMSATDTAENLSPSPEKKTTSRSVAELQTVLAAKGAEKK